MAKVAKVKKRDVSVHSRAARRGESGSDPSIAVRKGSVEESDYKPWLHNAQNAGVGKKKTKQLTRQQRLRQQRGLEKAEINVDKLDKKVADSKSRGKRVNARRVDWNELNDKLAENGVVNKKAANVNTSKGVDGAVQAMDTVVATDLDKPLEVRTVALSGSGEGAAQVPNATSMAQAVASEPLLDQDVDEIT